MILSHILFNQDILLNSAFHMFYFSLVELVELQREKEKQRIEIPSVEEEIMMGRLHPGISSSQSRVQSRIPTYTGTGSNP